MSIFTGEKEEIRQSVFKACPKCGAAINAACNAEYVIEGLEELEELKNQEQTEDD